MMSKYYLCLLMLLSFAVNAAAPISHFTVTVIDENNIPVEGAVVQGFFSNLKHGYVAGPERKGITNEKGVANVSGPAYFSVNINATKTGYYDSRVNFSVNKNKDQEISILLRPKRNPIPLYAKYFKGYIPKSKVKIYFDFLKGDWVSPFGKGINKDVSFYYDGFVNSFLNYEGELLVGFSAESDGVFELEYVNGKHSNLKLPYVAPEKRYTKSKLLVHKRKGKGISAFYEKNLNKKKYFGYFFRVRSEEDFDGNVSLANYVKIGGEIIFDPRSEGKGEAYIEMKYYFNPTPNDRNLEFDPEKNLFKNLKHEEKVWMP